MRKKGGEVMRTRIGRCSTLTSSIVAAAGRGGTGLLRRWIMDSLREFIGSSSGLAPARQGLGLGWVISALAGIAVLLGAKEAKADECEYRTYQDCSWNA